MQAFAVVDGHYYSESISVCSSRTVPITAVYLVLIENWSWFLRHVSEFKISVNQTEAGCFWYLFVLCKVEQLWSFSICTNAMLLSFCAFEWLVCLLFRIKCLVLLCVCARARLPCKCDGEKSTVDIGCVWKKLQKCVALQKNDGIHFFL